MADWKENKMVGIVAGIVFVGAVALTVVQLTRRPSPPPKWQAGMPATPSTTPNVIGTTRI
mgnify:CR=1 FL=1